jgi:PIN domain nuclease of toxin-antitoxin system
MQRYILDTHILVWFLEKNARLPDSIRDDIEYQYHKCFVSYLSLVEIDNLQKLGKIEIKPDFKKIVNQMQEANIEICFGSLQDLEVLFNLDMKTVKGKVHGDYIDKTIVATAISRRYTCISADTKFPYYRKFGLNLIEV